MWAVVGRWMAGVAVASLTAAVVSSPAVAALHAQTAPPGAAVVPFKIHVPDDVLKDLRQRLARARFGDEMPGAGWDYGTNVAYLKRLIEYWRDVYDWRAQE